MSICDLTHSVCEMTHIPPFGLSGGGILNEGHAGEVIGVAVLEDAVFLIGGILGAGGYAQAK